MYTELWKTNNKSSLAERVFVELLFFFTNSYKYNRAEWSTKALKVKYGESSYDIL